MTACALMALCACASSNLVFGSPQSQPVIDAVVLVAGHRHSGTEVGVPAAQINKVAKAALAAGYGRVTGTLAAVSFTGLTRPISKLAVCLPPTWPLLRFFEVALAAAITAKVGDNKDLAAARGRCGRGAQLRNCRQWRVDVQVRTESDSDRWTPRPMEVRGRSLIVGCWRGNHHHGAATGLRNRYGEHSARHRSLLNNLDRTGLS